jgi:rhamnose transport system substrate-binding protein
VTNSQIAVLCGAFLAGSAIVTGSNILLVRAARVTPPDQRTRIAMVPRFNGDPYFASCREGAEEAARELDVHLVWDGPNAPDSTAQFQILQTWLDGRVDAIAVAPSDPSGISLVLRKARARGIPVITWDSDAQPNARDVFVNRMDVDKATRILAAEAADLAGSNGEIAVLGGASPYYLEAFRESLLARAAGSNISTIQLASEDGEQAFRETREILRASRSLKLIVAFSPAAVGGAAEAVLLSRRKGIRVIGAGLPASAQRYLDSGIAPLLLHWDPRDLGYLTVYVAAGLARRKLDPAMDSVVAGRLGKRDFCGGEIVLGPPMLVRAHL